MTPKPSDDLPLVHRLVIIYLMLPVVIWLVGWFEWWFGVPAALLLALAIWPALRPARASLNWQDVPGVLRRAARPTTIALLFLSFAWVMVTAAGGVFDVGNWDWYKHRSILLDLGRGGWPTELLPELRAYLGDPILLRHYLGYYMAPGLVGRWLGPAALNWAVPLWTWCGVSLALFMFTRGHNGWRVLVAAAVLVFFGGMDFVRMLLFEGWSWINLSVVLQGWPRIELGSYHIEWAGNPWGVVIQYPSHTAGLMWAPTHFLPAALFSLLLIQLRKQRRFLAISGVVLAAAPFWSAFAAIGLLPFVAALLYQNGLRPFLRWQNALVGLPLAGLLAVYLSSGTSEIPRLWIWQIHEGGWLTAAKVLLTVYVFDFALVGILLFLLRPTLRRDPFFFACLATLVLVPFYYYGDNNDWTMRSVMPALFLLSYFAAGAVAGYSRVWVRSRDYVYAASFGLLVVTLGLGALTPLFDLSRANNNHDFGVIRHEELGPEYSVMRSPEVAHPRQNASNELPKWLLRLMRIAAIDPLEARGHQVGRSKYDVYLEGRRVIYVRAPCPEDEEGSRFFLHVTPAGPSALPAGRTHDNLDFSFTRKHAFKMGQTCFAVREVGDSYAIGRIKTGQLNAERTGHSWVVNHISEAFRERLLAEAGEPLVRSRFDIYLHGEQSQDGNVQAERRRLLYLRDGCSVEDAGARILLQVFPRNAANLPKGSEDLGYEVLDFDFAEFGGKSNGVCFAVRDLPDYRILAIRTGAYPLDGGGAAGIRIDLAE